MAQIKRRAVIYARASKDRSGRARSVEQQISECRQDIADHPEWMEGPIFRDNDISASKYATKERPGYLALLKELRSDDVLVVWEASRAGRRMEDFIDLRTLCEDREIIWCVGGRTYDMSDPQDRHQLTAASNDAELESARISKRVCRSMRSKAAEGRPHSHAPWGYRMVVDEDGKPNLEIDPKAGPLVRDAVERLLAGELLHQICQDWNRQRIFRPTSGRPWRTTQLRELVKRPAYAGIRVHRGERIKATWPALITEDQHLRVTALLDRPERRLPGGSTVAHLLSGIAKCGHCGEFVAATNQRGGRYRCDQGCFGRQKHKVDEHVVGEMLRLIEEWKADALLMDIKEEFDENGEPVGYVMPNDDFATYRNEAAALRQRLEEIEAEMVAGNIRASVYARAEQDLLPQIEALDEKARGELVHPILEAIGKDPREIWEGMDLLQRRQFIRMSFDVTINPVGRGKRFDPASTPVESRLPEYHFVSAQIVRGSKDASAPTSPLD